jgi:hypothetical protein
VGITRRVLRAPVSGDIVLIRDGKILLEVETPPYELQAGMVGVISDLIADHGAIVETTGALVQGVWGNGHMDFGLMQNELEGPDSRLTSDQLDVSLRGAVVLGGYCDDPHVFRSAADIPLKGLILASMSASLVSLALKMPYPIVVIGGFGFRPLDAVSYNLLTTNQNREVSVNAIAFDRYKGSRPEVVISLPSSSDPTRPLEAEDYAIGQKVRLIRPADGHSIGTIDHIFDQPVVLPSGIRAMSAQVVLENEETITIPLVNLEVLT